MPYTNREDKSARQRQRRREQRERDQQSAPQVALPTPQIATPRRTTRPPAPSFNYGEPRRADLLRTYQDLRARGLDETTAKTELQRQRNQQRRHTEQQHQDSQLQVRALLLMGEARRRLSMGGSYNETDVWLAAIELARADLQARQRPRLPDPAPRLLAAPVPGPPHAQSAGSVWMGRLRPATLSLGDGRAAAREESRTTVQALIAALIRQPASTPLDSVRTLPVAPLGVPRGLGALPADEMSETR
jgi:hypothetical protein